MFTAADYQTLASIVFALDADGQPRYPGYRPDVVELPNGDGRADTQKKYAHVNGRYLDRATDADWDVLWDFHHAAHTEAERVAKALGVPKAFWPDRRQSTLRVLEYPPGATSARHTDFDLFTLSLYRDRPEGLVRYDVDASEEPDDSRHTANLDAIASGLHLGELGELVGLGPATPHEVVPVHVSVDGAAPVLSRQHSIVYFCLPSHDAVLPGVDGAPGETVGQWLAERMARSRAPA